jgi:hypothetical protein
MCKCNAGGRGVPAFSPYSTTANPSLTDSRLKIMFSSTPAWLRATLTSCRFKASRLYRVHKFDEEKEKGELCESRVK